jgi:predicted O-methyltransferase YrrM
VNRHGVHSPFVFELIEKVFKEQGPQYEALESIRTQFLCNSDRLYIEDLGAGSSSGLGAERSVKDIARHSLSSAKQCRMLTRLLQHLQIKEVIEFGSCLGLSAAYMSEAGARVISMEGSEALHSIAKRTFVKDGIGPDFRLGAFDKTLPNILEELPKLDMAFVDGNHTKEATERYFTMLLPYVHNHTVLLFDDIHWSSGMESAWDSIRKHPKVTLSIDLFWCGMLFFRPGLSGEHFTLRY